MIKTKLIAVTNPVVEGIEDAKDLPRFPRFITFRSERDM